MTAPVQQLLITEEQIITPLTEVLGQVTPSPTPKSQEPTPSLKQSLDELFPEQQYEEKYLKRAKELLGKLTDQLNEEQLRDVVTTTQYLAETWLDDFERSIFKGQTLKELLHERGGK